MNNITIEDLITKVQDYNESGISKVLKAYEMADKLHKGQTRQSGEAYISHPLNVCYILADMNADTDTLCAALLHDTLEDSDITKEEIAKEFNVDVANLVDGVTKLAKMNFSTKQEQNLANTRKIITGITDDVRIIIIKLADRLHNMRTLMFKSPYKQKENALETMDIFVPLAYYIGAYRLKSELEDLSFYYLMPDEYERFEENKQKLEEDSNSCLHEMLYKIESMLNDRNIPNEIKVRTKNIYGIYKRLKEGSKLSDIHDLFALKVMVDEVENCYKSLYLVHKEYHPINNKFKDYICNPKTNMYRSLHTTVFAPDDRLVQVQLRTFDMDKVASFGLATYWDINNNNARSIMQEELRKKYQFFTSLKEIDEMFNDNELFVKRVKEELFSEKVYVYTPKGDVIELPKGSTLIDFAYRIDVGNIMISAKVNDRDVPVDYVLQNKDRVKIIVDELTYGPREEWASKVQTSSAKKKILEFSSNN